MALLKENLSGAIRGDVLLTQMVELYEGHTIPLANADHATRQRIRDRVWRESGIELQDQIKKSNLVVNTGRDTMVHQLGGDGSRTWISRVQLGDAKIAGVVSKDLFPPDLTDNRLIHEIRTLLGAPGATFELDPTTYPAVVTKLQPAGLPGTLTAGVTSTFTDATADFVAAGVDDKDKVTVYIGSEDFGLAIRRVVSATQLEVENPSLLSGAGVAYKITTPGGQVLFRKRINGNSFPESQYGPLTIAHEAGLLFSDGTLFNRVIFAPGSPTVGLALSPQNIDGITLSAQLDWLITI